MITNPSTQFRYNGLNCTHGGLYALIVHILVYYYFLPNSIKKTLTSFRGCSAGSLFLLSKIGSDLGILPLKYFYYLDSLENLQELLDLKWHKANVVERALLYRNLLKEMDSILPSEFKLLTFRDITNATGLHYCIETTKLKYNLIPIPIFEPLTMSSTKTPNESVWHAASSSANPLCEFWSKYDSFICDGNFNYDLFGNKCNVLHITTNDAAKDMTEDVIYVPKDLNTIPVMQKYLSDNYVVAKNRVRRKKV